MCILSERIFEEFGFFKGVVVMLAFDDYDFQKLVLDDAGKEEKQEIKRQSLRASGMVLSEQRDLEAPWLRKRDLVTEASGSAGQRFSHQLNEIETITKQISGMFNPPPKDREDLP